MRRRVVEIHLADKRVLRIVKVPALGLNHPPGSARVFFPPFGHNVVIGLDFEQALEDQRKALSGRLFEGQYPHEIVVNAEVPSVAFQVGFTEVVIEKGVVFKPSSLDLLGGKVQGLLENAEGLLFVEQTDRQEIVDLENEALDLLEQARLALSDLAVEEADLFATREMRAEFTESFGGPFRNIQEGTSEGPCIAEALAQNYVVDRKRKKCVCFGRKESDAILDGGVNDGFTIELVRDRFVVPFEEILVDAIVVVEQLECRFEALCQAVERVSGQTFVIDPTNLKDDAQVSGFGKENMRIDKAVQVHLFVE